MREPHRREPGRLDRLEIPPAAFPVHHILGLAETVGLADLDGRVAAAVEHERLVRAKETRGIHAEGEIAFEAGGFGVLPQALHRIDSSAALHSARSARKRRELYAVKETGLSSSFEVRVADWDTARAEA